MNAAGRLALVLCAPVAILACPMAADSSASARAGAPGLASFALVASLFPAPPTEQRVFTDEIGGILHVDSFHVPADTMLLVTSDLLISASEEIVIDGDLLGLFGGSGRSLDAPSIYLQSDVRIVITGRVEVGNGADALHRGVRTQGGNGGSIVLEAPQIIVGQTEFAAGHGGEGAASGHGGDGGDVFFVGAMVQEEGEQIGLRGGDGGHGGGAAADQVYEFRGKAILDGGDGGTGGDAHLLPWSPNGDSLEPERHGIRGPFRRKPALPPSRGLGVNAPDGVPCTNGLDGHAGHSARGGQGGPGGHAGHAAPPYRDGGNGGNGGQGGSAFAGDGGNGGNGGHCCEPLGPGGNGGNGGDGGEAFGGDGGDAGRGGNAFAGGRSGAGGNGGGGGNGSGGLGGNAGRGGNGCRPGEAAVGGMGGGGTGGSSGAGGSGGVPRGRPGNPGTPGFSAAGASGASSSPGMAYRLGCPQ